MLAADGATLRDLVLQYVRFASVGGAATAVHVVLFAALIELLQSSAVMANLAAFGAALLLSFVGHCRWTFRHRGRRRSALGRFTIVAGVGLGLNSAIAYGIADRLGWHYACAILLMVTVTPVALFLMSRFWAFAERSPRVAARGRAPTGRPAG
ncbi:MAG: GtrA family protein [Geminicoccaceae bacterium]